MVIKFIPSIPAPPEDVVDTTEEVKAYYRDVERDMADERDRQPDPGDY